MNSAKVTISLDSDLLHQLDELVASQIFPNRSQAVQSALRAALEEIKRRRFEEECRKLNPETEQEMADFGLAAEVDQWPTY